jgi:uncharacterized protein (DUF362 family)
LTLPTRRRDLIRGLVAAAVSPLATPLERAVSALPFAGPPPGLGSGPSRAVVAVGRRDGICPVPGGGVNEAKLEEALGAAVARAVGEADPVSAFRRLFRPGDVVGIKVNCLGGRGLSSRPEAAVQLGRWLVAAGVPADRIVIWDRSSRELKGCGFAVGSGAAVKVVKVVGTDGDWEPKVREWGPSASRFSRLLAEDLTAVINLAVLKDHGLAGVSAGLKNWYGVVHNPNKLHEEGCNPFVPHLAAFPLVRDKLRLTVVDGTTGQYHNGPGYAPSWAWPYQGFLVSTDAVAADAVAWKLIEEKRKEKGLKTLAAEGREPKAIGAAGRLGLGTCDPAKIEAVSV